MNDTFSQKIALANYAQLISALDINNTCQNLIVAKSIISKVLKFVPVIKGYPKVAAV